MWTFPMYMKLALGHLCLSWPSSMIITKKTCLFVLITPLWAKKRGFHGK